MKAIPGVQQVTFANRLPLRGNWSSGFQLDRAPQPGAEGPTGAGFQSVSLEYFDVFRIPLKAGRLFTAADRAGAPGVALVNEAFSREFFGGTRPIGERLRRGEKMPWITIVGVVADIRRGGRLADIEAQVYLPAPQIELYPLPVSDLALRVEREPRGLAEAVMSAIWAVDPNQPVTNVRTLDEVLALRLSERRFQTFLFSLFAAMALVLALISVYSVVDYTVRQRAAEIGLRLALGADAPGILRWLLGQSLALAAAGTVAGIAAAAWLSRYLRTLLFGIQPLDTVTYAGAALALLCATLAAAALAARRATRVDPAIALK